MRIAHMPREKMQFQGDLEMGPRKALDLLTCCAFERHLAA